VRKRYVGEIYREKVVEIAYLRYYVDMKIIKIKMSEKR
jgi:hypothetical protein